MSTIYSVNYEGHFAIVVIGGGTIQLPGIGVGVLCICRTLEEPYLNPLDILKWGVLVGAVSNGPVELFNRVQLLAVRLL